VFVDWEKIKSYGKPAIRHLLLKLHLFRCTADVEGCRTYYEELTQPDETFLEYRRMILSNKPARQIFVQVNTFIQGEDIIVKEYEVTCAVVYCCS